MLLGFKPSEYRIAIRFRVACPHGRYRRELPSQSLRASQRAQTIERIAQSIAARVPPGPSSNTEGARPVYEVAINLDRIVAIGYGLITS
jgi:hypothetical protein